MWLWKVDENWCSDVHVKCRTQPQPRWLLAQFTIKECCVKVITNGTFWVSSLITVYDSQLIMQDNPTQSSIITRQAYIGFWAIHLIRIIASKNKSSFATHALLINLSLRLSHMDNQRTANLIMALNKACITDQSVTMTFTHKLSKHHYATMNTLKWSAISDVSNHLSPWLYYMKNLRSNNHINTIMLLAWS